MRFYGCHTPEFQSIIVQDFRQLRPHRFLIKQRANMKDQNKKPYEAPKLRTYGDVGELTRNNNENAFSDAPIGLPGTLGYSPAAD